MKMKVRELIKKLESVDGEKEIAILRGHEGGGVTHHKILGPDEFYGFHGVCLSTGEQVNQGQA
jgi:hypothetical protein